MFPDPDQDQDLKIAQDPRQDLATTDIDTEDTTDTDPNLGIPS